MTLYDARPALVPDKDPSKFTQAFAPLAAVVAFVARVAKVAVVARVAVVASVARVVVVARVAKVADVALPDSAPLKVVAPIVPVLGLAVNFVLDTF